MIEKEAMGAQMQNELARIRVDTLNVTANNTQLEVQVKQVNEEIKEQDALVDGDAGSHRAAVRSPAGTLQA